MTPETERRLARSKNLPTLPGVAVQIIEMSEDPNVSMNQVARLVSQDPALAVRLLRIANSPLYAQRRSVDNLTQALMLLGLNAALSLALSFSLVQGLRGPRKPVLDYDRCWRRVLIAAAAARLLAPRARDHSAEDMFLAALLQDVGILALDQVLRDEGYGAFVNETVEHEDLVEAERARFGVDHVQAGRWLLQHWRLPEYLQDAVAHSHATTACQAGSPLERSIALSGRIADAVLGDTLGPALPFLAHSARQLLDMDGESLHGLLDELAQGLPDVEALFEIRMPDASERDALMEQARELLLLRNLRAQQTVTEVLQHRSQLERHAQALEEQVRRDGLTGAFNRAHLDSELARTFAESKRGGAPLSVLFMDLDHFKRVNDTWGHAAGDDVLVGVAQRLAGALRPEAMLGRYGGEEFVILLPGVGAASARGLAVRLKELLTTRPVAEIEGEPIRVTFSGGVATHGEANYFDTWEELVRAADRVMYAAKLRGRDCTMVYGEDD